MKRVKVYQPLLKEESKLQGTTVVVDTIIVEKKHKFLKECSVMDKVLEKFQSNKGNCIQLENLYMEEVEGEKKETKKPGRKPKEVVKTKTEE